MKTQNSQLRQTILLTVIATIILLCTSVSIFAQTGIGKKYGSRDPQACGNMKGATLTQAKALESFICHREKPFGTKLVLVEDASLELSKPRPYNMNEDLNVPNIDVTAKVYPIRGGFKKYFCSPLSELLQDETKNCLLSDVQKADGLCYKDTWGDWICSMDGNAESVESNPPGAKTNDNIAQKTAPKNDNKSVGDQPDKKADAETAQTGHPKPDFSEMEKWFEIVRYEYADPPQTLLTFWVKPKVEIPPGLNFGMQFLDKDGVLVAPFDTRYGFGVGFHGSGNVGEVMKMDCYTPSESNMERVVRAKIVRIKQ